MTGTPTDGQVVTYKATGTTLEWTTKGSGGGLSTVDTDTTLTGDGSSGDPLGVANPFTAADESKLDGIEAGAEVNAQSNWNETNSVSSSYIRNKPTITAPVNADWDASSGLAQILNKPEVPDLPTKPSAQLVDRSYELRVSSTGSASWGQSVGGGGASARAKYTDTFIWEAAGGQVFPSTGSSIDYNLDLKDLTDRYEWNDYDLICITIQFGSNADGQIQKTIPRSLFDTDGNDIRIGEKNGIRGIERRGASAFRLHTSSGATGSATLISICGITVVAAQGATGSVGPQGPVGPTGPAGSEAEVTSDNIISAVAGTPADTQVISFDQTNNRIEWANPGTGGGGGGGLVAVSHDSSLSGAGTNSSPLSVTNVFSDEDETKLDALPSIPSHQSATKNYSLQMPANSGAATWTEASGAAISAGTGITIVGNLSKTISVTNPAALVLSGTDVNLSYNDIGYHVGTFSFSGVPTLFMVGYGTDALYTLNSWTGVAARVGNATQFGVGEDACRGITSHNGALYMVGDTHDCLYRLNPATGVATRVGNETAFGVTPGETSPGGLASFEGSLYFTGLENDWLYTINVNTGAATRVGNSTRFGVGEQYPTGIAEHRGLLYMIGLANNCLYTLNVTTGAATRVGECNGVRCC